MLAWLATAAKWKPQFDEPRAADFYHGRGGSNLISDLEQIGLRVGRFNSCNGRFQSGSANATFYSISAL